MASVPRAGVESLDWPLMSNNITAEDRQAVIELLQGDPILTQSAQVAAFEEEWSAWAGVKHSVFVNSGSSANLLTLAAMRETRGPGEVILPTLTWVSDIAAALHTGLEPVFVDIDPRTLGMDTEQVLRKLTPRTRAVFITHILGFNALDDRLLDGLASHRVPLLEDVSESHGATFRGRRLGGFGLMSNFSFYYAHHLSTIEGGMVCTDDADLHEVVRMMRSHGMTREARSADVRQRHAAAHGDLNPDFIFAFPAWNVRSTEINAVMGRSQLKRLDENNRKRRANFELFLSRLDPARYRTDFATEGSCNYAFVLILRRPDEKLRDTVMDALRARRVEFRRGTSGGGNQLRQPYLRRLGAPDPTGFPAVDHVHFFGFYIGNYPDLPREKILRLAELLNSLPEGS
jgi:CDP-4-dehydro-6-deoxyglucose reductase, E1